MTRCVILSSGSGSVVQPLIDSAYFGEIKGLELIAVISLRPDSYALTRAKNGGVKPYTIERDVFPNDRVFQKAVYEKLLDLDTDLVIMAGFGAPLAAEAAKKYEGRALVLRPGLPGAFSAFSADSFGSAPPPRVGENAGGASVCWVDRSGKPGSCARSRAVEHRQGDTPADLAQRLAEAGSSLLIESVRAFCAGELNM